MKLTLAIKYNSHRTAVHPLLLKKSLFGAAYQWATENARPDIARLDKTAPYRKGGHRETCFIVRVVAHYMLIFAAGSII